MLISPDEIKRLREDAKGAFFILDLNTIRSNYNEFLACGKAEYERFAIAYSYKTNYTPAICKTLNDLGAYSEIVSEMEFEITQRLNIPPERIIVNGPHHQKEFLQRLLDHHVVINFDSFHQLNYVKEIMIEGSPHFRSVGLRINLRMDGEISRFGFDEDPEILTSAISMLESSGCKIVSIHCHLCDSFRDAASYTERANRMLGVYEKYFGGKDIETINLGGGFFSKMPPMLQEQFQMNVPTFQEYAAALAVPFNRFFQGAARKPLLVIEPGNALVADAMDFYTAVVDVKKARGRYFALLDSSIYDVKPMRSSKNLPVSVIPGGSSDVKENRVCDMVGYTCMENDVLFRNFGGAIHPGDVVVFHNVGGYTNVLKPPFINPARPIFIRDGDDFSVACEAQTSEAILGNYIF